MSINCIWLHGFLIFFYIIEIFNTSLSKLSKMLLDGEIIWRKIAKGICREKFWGRKGFSCQVSFANICSCLWKSEHKDGYLHVFLITFSSTLGCYCNQNSTLVNLSLKWDPDLNTILWFILKFLSNVQLYIKDTNQREKLCAFCYLIASDKKGTENFWLGFCRTIELVHIFTKIIIFYIPPTNIYSVQCYTSKNGHISMSNSQELNEKAQHQSGTCTDACIHYPHCILSAQCPATCTELPLQWMPDPVFRLEKDQKII